MERRVARFSPEKLEEMGYYYDFDMRRWLSKESVEGIPVKDRTPSVLNALSKAPPFGITDELLYKGSIKA